MNILLIFFISFSFVYSVDEVEILERSCISGNSADCVKLGLMYSNAEGVKQNKLKAKELFDKACKNNYSNGCLGYSLLKSQGY